MTKAWVDGYRAPAWLQGGHLQTIWSATMASTRGDVVEVRNHVPQWKRERWTAPDGDFIDVDVITGQPGQPHLTLFHGLEGSSNSHYALAFAACAHERGWSIAVPHFRTCSGEANRMPRAYHSGDYGEIDWILQRMRSQYGERPHYAVGVSLGGNALMKWVGTQGVAANQRVHAAAAIGAPLDLMAAGHAIGQGLNRLIYTPMFLRTMKCKAMAKWKQFPGLFELDKALNAKTLEAFDDAFTAPLHGFNSVQDYWRRASAKPHLSDVALPSLLLNARNDPFVPWRTIRDADMSRHVECWQPRDGGHVGYVQRTAKRPVRGDLLPMPRAVMAWLEAKGEHHG